MASSVSLHPHNFGPYTDTRHDNMIACHLDDEAMARTAGPYRYTVSSGGYSHIAFRTREALLLWMVERRLAFATGITALSEGITSPRSCSRIVGSYISRRWWVPLEEFERIQGTRSVVMSNGDWTESIITEEDGVRVINHLNVNTERKVYHRQADGSYTHPNCI